MRILCGFSHKAFKEKNYNHLNKRRMYVKARYAQPIQDE